MEVIKAASGSSTNILSWSVIATKYTHLGFAIISFVRPWVVSWVSVCLLFLTNKLITFLILSLDSLIPRDSSLPPTFWQRSYYAQGTNKEKRTTNTAINERTKVLFCPRLATVSVYPTTVIFFFNLPEGDLKNNIHAIYLLTSLFFFN